MGVRNWVIVAGVWAMTAAPALAAGPDLAGGPPSDAGPIQTSSRRYEHYSRSVEVRDQRGDALQAEAARPLPRPAYIAPDEPGYAPVQSYNFRGYDQAVYAAAPGPAYDGGFRGYDQAIYAAEGQRRYLGREADPAGYDRSAGYDDRYIQPPEPEYAPPPPPPPPPPPGPARTDVDCPRERPHERVVHCEYRPYWQEVTVSGEFSGGVGEIPVGGGGRGGGVVIVNTGGGLSAGVRARAYASASASAHAGVRIGGGCACGGKGR